MATTIAVSKQTLDVLKKMRHDTNSTTYDETIQKLVMQSKKPKESWFGKAKDLQEFKREEIDRFA